MYILKNKTKGTALMENNPPAEKRKTHIVVIITGIVILIGAAIAIFTLSRSLPRAVAGEDQPTYRRISAEEAKKIMDTSPDAIILDVRTNQEYAEKHIARSTLLPLSEIEAKAPTALPDKNAQILIYCRRGNRSKTAANLLISIGYKNVSDFGGIETWPYGTARE
jgi:rhodanese-related sulfurtransferase